MEVEMKLDDIPEYREMRKGLMALRLVVEPSVADDLLSICEKAILTVRDEAYAQGRRAERELDQECREALA